MPDCSWELKKNQKTQEQSKNTGFLCKSTKRKQKKNKDNDIVNLDHQNDINTTGEETNPADKLFCDYFDEWINLYKRGAIRELT